MTDSEVWRVGVRVPPFWPEEPALWFAQLECQFELSRVTTEDTKFSYLVAQLDHQYAIEVKDVITRPPEKDKYTKLKTELIKRLSASKEKRTKQLLMHEELGDRKPSQLLRHLESLAGPSVPMDFLTTIWTSRLPQNIQTVIASQTDLSIDKLGELADKVHEIAPTTPQVSEASTSTGNNLDELARQVSELTKQVAALSSNTNNRARAYTKPRYNKRYRSRSRSRPRQPPQDHPHCYYHYTYGSKANKCRQPCTFPTENAQGGRK